MPRYVILEHDHPTLHWDFMLEIGAALRTWRLAEMPADGLVIAATPLGDHRLAYLEYEGAVSGNRGCVRRWDCGEFDELNESEGRLTVRLCGQHLRGEASLQSVGNKWAWHYRSQSRDVSEPRA